MRLRAGGAGLLLLLGVSTGCVYYNGVYNAEAEARTAITRLGQDREEDAREAFRRSAAAAESVYLRHPESPWRTHVGYLAGRGAALAGECDQGERRLREFLSADQPADRRGERRRRSPNAHEEAMQWTLVALASCDVRLARPAVARERVDSILVRPRLARAVSRQARLWGARAALAQGDLEAVPRYLGPVASATLPWELLGAALAIRAYATVESLTVDRGLRGDYRDEAQRAVRELASARWFGSAERVVAAYDRGRTRAAPRALLHLALADGLFRTGDDSTAARHLRETIDLAGRDSLLAAEAGARLGVIAVRRGNAMETGDSLWAAMDSLTRRTSVAQRFREQWLLVRLLVARDEGTGAGRFLAAEVLRDSLRATAVAARLFADVGRSPMAASLAPLAWHAAGLLRPDSADEYRRRILTEYGFSAVAARLAGEDPASRPDFVSSPELLRFAWGETVRVWGDSVRRLRSTRGSTTRSGAP